MVIFNIALAKDSRTSYLQFIYFVISEVLALSDFVMSTDAILKITIKLSQLKISQLGSLLGRTLAISIIHEIF